MTLSLIIILIGYFLVALALVHAVFPQKFNWAEELPRLSLVNHQMMTVHTFFIALFVGLNGLLCITSADLLIETGLGRRISLGLAIFWGIRLLTQFFWYSPKLWKGKTFETIVHILFSLFWLLLTVTFSLAAKGISTVGVF